MATSTTALTSGSTFVPANHFTDSKDAQDITAVAQQTLNAPSQPNTIPIGPSKVVPLPSSPKKKSNTYNPARSGVFSVFKTGVSTVTSAISSAAVNISVNVHEIFLDSDSKINEAKAKMREMLADEQFVEFSELMMELGTKIFKKILESVDDQNEKDSLLKNQLYIEKLIKVNIANSFARLSETISTNKVQKIVERLMILFGKADVQKLRLAVSSHFEELKKNGCTIEKLAEIYQKSLKNPINLNVSIEQEQKEIILQEIRNILYQNSLESLSIIIFGILNREKELEKINLVQVENQRKEDLNSLFSKIADELITLFFNEEAKDFELPMGGRKIIYEKIKNEIVDFLLNTYPHLQKGIDRNEAWQEILGKKIGNQNIQSPLDALFTLGKEFTKVYIKIEPKAVEVVEGCINTFLAGESQKKEEELVHALSHRKLALWILKSLQVILDTEDPTLQEAGKFLTFHLKSFILGVLAKGSDLVISQNENVDSQNFIPILVEKVIDQAKNLAETQKFDDKTSLEFWKSFIDELIPPDLKNFIANLLVKISKSFQEHSQKVNFAIKETRRLYCETLDKIQPYRPFVRQIASFMKDKFSSNDIEILLLKVTEIIKVKGDSLTIRDLVEVFFQLLPDDNLEVIEFLKQELADKIHEAEILQQIKKVIPYQGGDEIFSISRAISDEIISLALGKFQPFTGVAKEIVRVLTPKNKDSNIDLVVFQNQLEQLSKNSADFSCPSVLRVYLELASQDDPLHQKENQEAALKLLEKNQIHQKLKSAGHADLIESWGLKDVLDDLFAEYLPGITLDEEFIRWFKTNMSALGSSQYALSNIELLKEGMHVFVLTSIVNNLEMDYANQPYRRIAQQMIELLETDKNIVPEIEVLAYGIQQQLSNSKDVISPEVLMEVYQKVTPFGGLWEQNEKEAALKKIIESQLIEKIQVIAAFKEKGLFQEKTFANQLLNNIFVAFTWAFQRFSNDEKIALTEILAIQNETKKIQTHQTKIKEKISYRPEMIPQVWKEIEECLHLGVKAFKSEQHYLTLLAQYQNNLTLLARYQNNSDELGLTEKDIEKIKKALEYQRSKQYEFNRLKKDPELKISSELDVLKFHLKEINKNLQDLQLKLEKEKKNKKIREDLEEEILQNQQELECCTTLYELLTKKSEEELNAIKAVFDIENPLKEAEINAIRLRNLLEDKKGKLVQRSLQEGLEKWSSALSYMNETLNGRKQLIQLDAQLQELENRFNERLGSFPALAKELIAVLGLDNPERLSYSPFLQEYIWPIFDNYGEKHLARFLLEQLAPLFVVTMEKEQNKQQLHQKTGSYFLGDLGGCIAKEIVEKVISKITSYKPFVEDLTKVLKIESISQEQVHQLAHQIEILSQENPHEPLTLNLLIKKVEDVIGCKVQASYDVKEGEAILKKINEILVSPEAIARKINEYIPGAQELHTLIAPQLQAIILGKDPVFGQSKELLQSHLESLIIQTLLTIVNKNEKNILVNIARKLKELPELMRKNEWKTKDEASSFMVNYVLGEILGIGSENDLIGLPLILRAMVFNVLKEKLKVQLDPVILPLLDKEKDRKKLEEKSGSKLLGQLSGALAHDITHYLSHLVKSYRQFAVEILQIDTVPNSDMIDLFTKKIIKIREHRSVNNEILIHILAEVTGQTFSKQKIEDLQKLLPSDIAKKINTVVKTPEAIAHMIQEIFPSMSGEMENYLAREIQHFIHSHPVAYENAMDFAQDYIDGMLLKIFNKIADKNPKKGNKDTFYLILDTLFQIITNKNTHFSNFAEFAKALNELVIKQIFGVESSQDLPNLPPLFESKAYLLVKDTVAKFLEQAKDHLNILREGSQLVEESKENLKKLFGNEDPITVGKNLGKLAVDAITGVLGELIEGEDRIKGVNLISEALAKLFDDLTKDKMQTGHVLSTHGESKHGNQLQDLLGVHLGQVTQPDHLTEAKTFLAEVIGNLVLLYMDKGLSKIWEVDDQTVKEIFIAGITSFTEHFSFILTARSKDGILTHKNFVEAAGHKLHKGVPINPPNYKPFVKEISRRIGNQLRTSAHQEALEKKITELVELDQKAIKPLRMNSIIAEIEKILNRRLSHVDKNHLCEKDLHHMDLKDYIRQEAERPDRERYEGFYKPHIEKFLAFLFPKGEENFEFLSPPLKEMFWNIFEGKLAPLLMSVSLEKFLDPDNLTSVVNLFLDIMNESMQEEILYEKPQQRDFDELDKVSGKLISNVLEMVDLHPIARKTMNNILKEKDGSIKSSMQQMLGSVIRSKIPQFIQKKNEMLFKKLAQNNPDGTPFINFNIPNNEKILSDRKIAEEENKVKTQLLFYNGIRYATRSYLIQSEGDLLERLKARFDGKGKISQALYVILRTFIKIGFAIARFFCDGFVFVFKRVLIYLCRLEKNRQSIMNLLRVSPKDQPQKANQTHVVYNENVIFDAIQKTIDIVSKPIDANLQQVENNRTQFLATSKV